MPCQVHPVPLQAGNLSRSAACRQREACDGYEVNVSSRTRAFHQLHKRSTIPKIIDNNRRSQPRVTTVMSIRKLTIGILSKERLFKVPSLWGVLIDEILSLRGDGLSETFFKHIGATENQGIVLLADEKRENSLRIDINGIILTKDTYDSGIHVDQKEVIAAFTTIWNTVQKVVQVRQVARIGIVAEQYIEGKSKSPSATLAKNLTNLSIEGHPAKFSINFQSRKTLEVVPEERVNETQFKNVIYQIYDSSADSEHPVPDRITLSVDLQKYYWPPLKKRILDEVEALGFDLPKEIAVAKAALKKAGVGSDSHD